MRSALALREAEFLVYRTDGGSALVEACFGGGTARLLLWQTVQDSRTRSTGAA